MNSHTSDSRPNSSADQTPSKEKPHSYLAGLELNLSSQRRSHPTNSRASSSTRRPQSLGTNSIRSDGSWKAPEVLAWKRPQRAARVIRCPATPERQANRCQTFTTVRGDPVLQDQKRAAYCEDPDNSFNQATTEAREISKHHNAPCDETHLEATERQARRIMRDVRHQSTPVTLDPHHNIFAQQHRDLTSQDKLISLSKDFHNQVFNPMSNRCVQPSEEGMASSLASQKVVHWLKTSRNRTERPQSASLTQALRFTALLAQVPLADAGLDEKIIPSRYNPQNRTAQGSRFVGC
ncbi:hypothetical protein OPQ81_004047 [Rhizoctonia solani]|nr:hypothetical protein OPQ81_004047 [Rhizoctonia solani]